MEKNRFRRAVQEPCNAALAGSRKDHLGAAVVDGMKIASPRHPHTGQAGEMIDLIDAAECIVDKVPIKHRSSDVLHFRQRSRRRLEIEHPHTSIPRDERRNQVLPDEPAAARDKYPCHEWGCNSP